MVNRSKVFDDAGLGMVERGQLVTSVLMKKNLSGILDRIDADTSISDANKEKLLKAVADKYKKDPAALDRLEKDLADNPALAKKLEQAIKSNPAAIAERGIPAYTGGNLDAALNSAVPAAAPARKPGAAPSPAPSPAAAPADRKTEPATAPKTERPAGGGSRRHQAPDAAPSSAPAAAPAAAPTPNADGMKAIIESLATGDNDTIKKIVEAQGPKLVNGLAHGMADMAREKFGVPATTADAFEKRIKDDPKLRESITENFKKNPDFVRQMAKMAQGGGDVPDAMKEMARKEMDKLMQNPQLLADDKYVKDISRQMRMGNTMGRLSGFLQDTFGIDMSGAMGGMGGFFQGIANWFKDFLGAFSGGGVKDFLSQPSNKNLGMFDKLSAGIGFAMNKANNQYHSPYEGMRLRNEQPLAAADGSYFHTEMRKNAQGVETPHRVPNTIEVRTVNNTVHKVIPTAEPLSFTRLPGGNYEIKLATDLKEGAKPGDRPVITGQSSTLVVTAAELVKINDATQKMIDNDHNKDIKAALDGRKVGVSQPKYEPATINSTGIESTNGQIGATVQVYPVAPQPNIESRPLEPSTAKQDLNAGKKAALDQAALTMGPPI